jgi:hypothetical protein
MVINGPDSPAATAMRSVLTCHYVAARPRAGKIIGRTTV